MNQPIARRLAPAAILALTAVTAHAQDAGVASGHAFAREACIACHVVEPEPQKPRVVVIGPAFRDIANTRGMTCRGRRTAGVASHG
jgi:cytochrome c551/c552